MEKTKKIGFPNYFKKIGIMLIIVAFTIGIGFKLLKIDLNRETKDLLKIVSLDLIILGMTFIAFAKDQIEDEMTVYLRLKSILSAFVFGIIFVIIYPFANLAFSEPIINDINSQQLILTVLFVQITTYYGMKKAETK